MFATSSRILASACRMLSAERTLKVSTANGLSMLRTLPRRQHGFGARPVQFLHAILLKRHPPPAEVEHGHIERAAIQADLAQSLQQRQSDGKITIVEPCRAAE